MKKVKQKDIKKKSDKPMNSMPKNARMTNSSVKTLQKKQGKQKPVRNLRKKVHDKKGADGRIALVGHIQKARQFLRESKMELKKVKWPTKKELLASTAVVLFLSLLMAFYFFLVDWGLMAIIKRILA